MPNQAKHINFTLTLVFLLIIMFSGRICVGFVQSVSKLGYSRTIRTFKSRKPLDAPSPVVIDPAYTYHYPVMKDECCDFLNIRPGGVYVDCTLGGGGHTKAILDRGGKVIGFDQDPDAINRSTEILQNYIDDGSCEIIQSNFRSIKSALANSRLAGGESGRNGLVDGVLMDLGVSSFQINEATRGFAFGQDGPLDMRMSKGEVGAYNELADNRLSAHDIINTWSAEDIANVFYNYGDEVRSRPIARQIVLMRPLNTTGELVNIIASKTSFQDRSKTLARCFQALRIVVNDEIGALEDALSHMHECIRHGGRFVVMSYHSLEDRRVKHLFRTGRLDGAMEVPEGEQEVPTTRSGNKYKDTNAGIDQLPTTGLLTQASSGNPWLTVTKRAVTPTDAEIALNRRARSAKLRVADQAMLHPGEDNNVLLASLRGTDRAKRTERSPTVSNLGAKQLAKMKKRESSSKESKTM